MRYSADKHFASKLAMKDTQENSVLTKFVKMLVTQWSPQVDLASHVSGAMQAFESLTLGLQVSEAILVR